MAKHTFADRFYAERQIRETENSTLKAKLLSILNSGISVLRSVCGRTRRLCEIADEWLALRMGGSDEAINAVIFQIQVSYYDFSVRTAHLDCP